MVQLKGVVSALVTPLGIDNTLDTKKFETLIEFQIANGVDSLLVLGGTGEYTAMTGEERKNVVRTASRIINNRVPMVVGNLEPGIGESMAFCQFCVEAGADAVLIITPYYLRATQEGMYAYYKKIMDSVALPVYVYNFPAKTGVNILPETMEKLANACPNLAGIKECSPDMGQAADLINRVGDKISVLSGDESSALSHLVMGARGVVMASSNFIPQFWANLCRLVDEGNYKEAVKEFLGYYDLFQAVYAEPNPGPMKYALDLIGVPGGEISTPLQKPSEETKQRLRAEMKKRQII